MGTPRGTGRPQGQPPKDGSGTRPLKPGTSQEMIDLATLIARLEQIQSDPRCQEYILGRILDSDLPRLRIKFSAMMAERQKRIDLEKQA